VYALGETGPGGGIVFYVQAGGGTFTSTGSDCADTNMCKYLEAAPVGWGNGILDAGGGTRGTASADPLMKWCSNTSILRNLADKSAIGDGRANTATGTQTGWAACTNGAIYQAELYAGGGQTDWHLPSTLEQQQMSLNNTLIGLVMHDYHTSTENNADVVYYVSASPGLPAGQVAKWNTGLHVRPIRAFG
jgi:hypothetical protein